jgi:Tol biopolymer transport system component
MILEEKGAGAETVGSARPEPSATRAPKPEMARSSMVPLRKHPLTGAQGLEGEPKFSPDGSQIAFAWNHGDNSNNGIYVKSLAGGPSVPLTSSADENYDNPVWSRDGRAVSFIHYSPHTAEILSVPASGGRLIKIADVVERAPLGKGGLGTGMDSSHDGKYLVIPDKDVPDQPFGLFLLNTETHERRRLTSPIANDPSLGDLYPAFSPDDQKIAFIRSRGLGVEDVYVTSLEGGAPQRLTNDNARIAGLTWMPDGQSILFASKRIGTFDLWRVAISDGSLEDLGVSGDLVANPAVSPDGSHLAFMEDMKNVNLWRVGIPETGAAPDTPIKLVSSAKIETLPQYSPDGKKIVYESTQSGDDEIWVCDSDGTNATQLTSFRGPITGTPRWAPDSRRVVFDSRSAGTSDIYMMSIDETNPHRLTEGKGDSHVPSWSVDGQWIFFASNRTGRNEIWKLPVKEGPAVQVTRHGGFGPQPSPDGKYIYYAKGDRHDGLWRIPIEGGAEELILDKFCTGCWGLYAISDRGIYFAVDPMSNHPVIQFLDLETKKTSLVFAPSKRLAVGNPGLTLSPDGKFLLFAQVDLDQSNIMLMDISH